MAPNACRGDSRISSCGNPIDSHAHAHGTRLFSGEEDGCPKVNVHVFHTSAGTESCLEEDDDHLHLQCPRFEAEAEFQVENVGSTGQVTVGFIQVVDYQRVGASYSTPRPSSQSSSCPSTHRDYRLRVQQCHPSVKELQHLPFYSGESHVTCCGPYAQRGAKTASLASAVPGMAQSHSGSLSMSDSPRYQIPLTVDASEQPTTSSNACNSDESSPSQPLVPSPGHDVNADNKLVLSKVTCSRSTTTWLCAYNSRNKALVPLSAVQQTTSFTVNMAARKLAGRRAQFASQDTQLTRLSRLPKIPSHVLQPSNTSDGLVSTGEHLNWSRRAELMTILEPLLSQSYDMPFSSTVPVPAPLQRSSSTRRRSLRKRQSTVVKKDQCCLNDDIPRHKCSGNSATLLHMLCQLLRI